MKIGIFTDSYKPYTSGVVTSISNFKEELTRLGHEIHIFAPSYPSYDEIEENVHRYFSLPSPSNPDFTLAIPIYPGMDTIVKNLQLDIVHVHSPFTMGRVGLRYAKKLNIPLLFTYHTRYDQYVHYVPLAHDLAREVTIKYSSNFCNHCNHIITPSFEIESIIRAFKVKTPISVIPSGVPIDKYEGGDAGWLRKHYSIPANNRILLFVGRLTQEKNIPFLIQSFKEVKASQPDTTLVIIAQGPLEEELKNLVKSLGLSLNDDVIFTGVLPFSSLVNAYYSADLFVFSSLTETQGLVLIEAMAAGLPVVAVRASGVREMVDDGIDGLLTECDTGELAAGILRVLKDDKLYHSLQINARKKADQLSSHNMALKLEQVYMNMVSTNKVNPDKTLNVKLGI
ncbi:MAG: glycosyltransferase family 4 protein [Firmicutes bacterium HGW-Firmicutes-15]|nr:MAG: glycosyltransferase family 4 protein [Firmicutes bacterium HGW-Firmicutes-15]